VKKRIRRLSWKLKTPIFQKIGSFLVFFAILAFFSKNPSKLRKFSKKCEITSKCLNFGWIQIFGPIWCINSPETVVFWLKKLFFFGFWPFFLKFWPFISKKSQFFENFEFLVWLGPPRGWRQKKIFRKKIFFLENLLLELPELTEIGMLNTR